MLYHVLLTRQQVIIKHRFGLTGKDCNYFLTTDHLSDELKTHIKKKKKIINRRLLN